MDNPDSDCSVQSPNEVSRVSRKSPLIRKTSGINFFINSVKYEQEEVKKVQNPMFLGLSSIDEDDDNEK